MELIDTSKIEVIEEAHKIINDLQQRLLSREQALDDLARAVEIAEITNQFQLVQSFRVVAEEQLQDRVIVPAAGEDQDIKIQIIE